MKFWAILAGAFMEWFRSLGNRQFAGRTAERAARRRGGDHDGESEDVGGGVIEVIAVGNTDRLQRRPQCSSGSEEEGGGKAAERIPSGEDHERHRHQALAR